MHYFGNFIGSEIILLLAHDHLLAYKYVLVTMGNQLYLNSETLQQTLDLRFVINFSTALGNQQL